MADRPASGPLTLPRRLNSIGRRAVAEAVARRAGAVEAEHVLLAILATDTPASARLAQAGLDYTGFDAALRAERERSIGAAGVAAPAPGSLASTPRATTPGWGASVRELVRSADRPAARDGRPGALEVELAAAILRARIGTVPRALAIAGRDRADLLSVLNPG
jgi:hypothetical protein